jgi:hypothetical protein
MAKTSSFPMLCVRRARVHILRNTDMYAKTMRMIETIITALHRGHGINFRGIKISEPISNPFHRIMR